MHVPISNADLIRYYPDAVMRKDSSAIDRYFAAESHSFPASWILFLFVFRREL